MIYFNQILQSCKEWESKLVGRILKRDYVGARDFSNGLLKKGVQVAEINNVCFPVFKRISRGDLNEGKKLAEVFKDYKWSYWLDLDL